MLTPGKSIDAVPSKDTPPIVLAVSRAVAVAAAPAEVANVAVAALPEVSWLPAALTPGRLIDAEPSKDTPPIVLGVASLVAVAELPTQLSARVAVEALPDRLPMM